MKNKMYLLIFILMTFASCEKFLEEEAFDFLTDTNFPTNYEEGRIALNGAYKVLNHNYIRGYQYVTHNPADSDLSSYGANLTNVYGAYQSFNRSATDAYPQGFWVDAFSAINSCNFVIEVVQEKGFDSGELLIAEARALRAFMYMELTNNFGDVPLKTTNTASPADINKPRTSVDEIRQLCIEDLTYAETIMAQYPEEFAVYTKGGLLTLGAVKMIKAHLYMYMAGWRKNWDGQMVQGDSSNWTNVRDLCREIINLGVYQLDPDYTNVFKDYYLDTYNKESIWEIDAALPDNGATFPNAITAGPYGSGSAGGFANIRGTKDFYDLFDPGDVRRDWTIGQGSFSGYEFINSSAVYSRPFINKFRKVPGNGDYGFNTPYNVPVYRFSDVYLMLAEALNEINNGPDIEAYNAINLVRYRARPDENKTDGTVLPDLNGLNYESFKNAIIDERAVELAFEGHRRMDLIRWGIFLERIRSLDASYGPKAEIVSERDLLLPIPAAEKLQIPDWEQNKDW